METTRRNLLRGMAAAPTLALPAIHFSSRARAATPSKIGSQIAGAYRFWVGEIEVTALLDGYLSIPTDFVSGYEAQAAEEATKRAYKPFDPEQIALPINGYVVNTGKNLVLIDAGAPKAAGPETGGLTANLLAAGINPDDIDTLLFTHLHIDHVGALLDEAGNKAFKNAVLTSSETEWNFTHDDAVYAALSEGFQPFFDASRQLIKPYAADRVMFNEESEILPGITAIPLPGHTPGHTGFALQSEGESMLIWGDVIHVTGLQFAHPEWGIVFDADPEQAIATRRSMLDRASADRMAVAGMHIDFPGLGYIEREKDAYRYISAPWAAKA